MAISFIQYDDYYIAAPSTSIANDTALNTTTGNFLVVIIGGYGGAADSSLVTGISDTAGNTYTKAIHAFYSGGIGNCSQIWYAENITGNANNVTTATYKGNTSYRYISVAEFSGVPTSNSLLDTSSQANAGATSHSSGTATSQSSGDLIIGGYTANASENITKGTGFEDLSSDITAVYDFAEYDILGAAGNYDADCTTGTTANSIMTAAIFGVTAGPSGTNIQINVGDAWKEVSAMKVNVGDAWKEVAAVKVNVGDAWKEVF